ncbi:hypothetical protein E2562_023707 [Oryza meyeriana var. granulata]|uniref:Uncharacterized protein n=1 Tax=Oryza meyeriana var. granulata TaxID=110450 RepID=A0A6G1BNA9_9ORYZ|nr:hypothetical protein E2562_023707 [Oryza meyeriana var. granulata]
MAAHDAAAARGTGTFESAPRAGDQALHDALNARGVKTKCLPWLSMGHKYVAGGNYDIELDDGRSPLELTGHSTFT